MSTIFHRDLERAEMEVERLKSAYLERWGWHHTSNTPGSVWIWRRDFADVDAKSRAWHEAHPAASPHAPLGVITAPTDTAIYMTLRSLDHQPELEQDEEDDAA